MTNFHLSSKHYKESGYGLNLDVQTILYWSRVSKHELHKRITTPKYRVAPKDKYV